MEFRKIRVQNVKKEISVSEDGSEIFYNDKPVHLSLIKNKNHTKGYYQVSIEGQRLYVHRLVAEAFVSHLHPTLYKFVIHKDCNTLNNHFKNLMWGDRKMITENRVKNGIQNVPNMSQTYRGSSKINHEEALKIAKRLENGEYAKDICKEYDVSEMSIARIRKRYVKIPASRRFDRGVKKTVLKLLQSHKPHELVKVTGIQYHTLYRWNKELPQKEEKL